MLFTCTLFAPTVEFEQLHSREAILTWFTVHFPDALSLIGEEALLKDFNRNPLSPLISTKVCMHHISLPFCY
jgi:kynurenine 3-monooxygenase